MPHTSDMAVVVTVHHEGRELTPTFNALGRTIAYASALTIDVVIVQDRADAATKRAVQQAISHDALSLAASVTVISADHGDLSMARNQGIEMTTAPLVGVLDADNLPSQDWLLTAHDVLSAQNVPAIVHPEAIITFGGKREVWPLMPSTTERFAKGWLAWFNPWDAFVIADRRVFERFAYRASRPSAGFGPEDWAWNCDTVAANIPHLVAPGTTLFYRATSGGLAGAHHASLLPRNGLLTDRLVARDALDRMSAPPIGPTARPLRERRVIGTSIRMAAAATRPLRRRLRAKHDAPAPIRDDLRSRRQEWASLHALQPDLPYPSDETLRSYRVWGEDWDTLFTPEQRAHWSGIIDLPARIDVLFVAPWLRTGGADLLTLQYINAVRRTRPDAVIALVTTEPEPSTRLHELDDVSVFDLGRFRLDPQFGVRVLGTLIAQLQPATVHVVNSTLGFDVIDRYGTPLSAHTNLFASTYVIDTLTDGTDWSFLHHRSRDFYNRVQMILTDNAELVETMVRTEGAPLDSFLVHNAVVDSPPSADEARTPPSADNAPPLRVVWAGRFDRQKRLDRFADIVEASAGKPMEFHFYGDQVISDDPNLSQTLERLEHAGAHRHPPYEGGFSRIASDADVLIMTSDREGLPNTLLEASASGVPVVAPAVGDIPRVINGSTGYLIRDRSSTATYLAALSAIADAPEEARIRANQARHLVEQEFSPARLDRTLEALPGYLPRRRGGRAVGYRWYSDQETADVLSSGEALTLIYTGSNGHSNFGDILQNKNIIAYWSERPDRTPVLFLPAFAAETPDRVASLKEWFRCPHIVFFSATREAPPGLSPLSGVSTAAPVHVVGGGYLNAMWGHDHFGAIDAIASDFHASQVFFTGLQIDIAAISGFERLAEAHRVPFVGVRDRTSLDLLTTHSSLAAIDTFDDLTEVLEEWGAGSSPRPVSGPASGPRVAIHMNTSDYAGGDGALLLWRDALARVARLEPRDVVLLSAYSDVRPEVRDTVGTVAALGEDYPFSVATLIDTARIALESQRGEGMPAELQHLADVDFGLSSSYHTALMMSFLGIPTYLMGANGYFGQKARLFQIPSLDAFLADPQKYVLDLDVYRATRRGWVDRLDGLTFGEDRSSEPS
ncbi:glycosyltransferase [uncultured Microbacterium sp.]|uniref:glycosyltransferase n=1 Tax=uncultured Microbacterium sp. TaxID=191216 RepID=UPI0026295592|nr:glycosyltransferase [uncultured Microbacterium sp.]